MKFTLFIFSILLVFACTTTALAQSASPTPAAVSSMVPVASPAAPPQWAQDVIVYAQGLPLVGPVVSKVMLYAGILAGCTTTLAVALVSILQMLSKGFSSTGLISLAEKIEAFKNSKVVYWITYFSMLNAQKSQAPIASAPVSPAVVDSNKAA